MKLMHRLFKWIQYTLLMLIIFSILSVLLFRWINPPVTMLMMERKVSAWRNGSSLVLKRQWKDLSAISAQLKLAVIAAEDQNFPYHHGFDIHAIKKALAHNAKGGTTLGASTITQQVAKNIFLWSGRTWVRKGIEIWFTVWIELLWTKERILEIYLNSIEWGEGVFGAEAASQYYFFLPAEQLTIVQASAMAAVVPNPLTWNPLKPDRYIEQRIRWIKRQMGNLGGVTFLTEVELSTK